MVKKEQGQDEETVEVIEVIEVEESVSPDESDESNFFSEEAPKEEKKGKSVSIKTASIIAGVIILIALGYYYRGMAFVATVNGSPISRLAVVQYLEANSGKEALDALITEKLIGKEADKNGVEVTDEDITTQIQLIEESLSAQGGTLEDALTAQGMTRDELNKQIIVRKQLEKLLADKTKVTDEEVQQYIATNEVDVPKGQEAEYALQLKAKLEQDKFGYAAQELIDYLKKEAQINYWVTY